MAFCLKFQAFFGGGVGGQTSPRLHKQGLFVTMQREGKHHLSPIRVNVCADSYSPTLLSCLFLNFFLHFLSCSFHDGETL